MLVGADLFYGELGQTHTRPVLLGHRCRAVPSELSYVLNTGYTSKDVLPMLHCIKDHLNNRSKHYVVYFSVSNTWSNIAFSSVSSACLKAQRPGNASADCCACLAVSSGKTEISRWRERKGEVRGCANSQQRTHQRHAKTNTWQTGQGHHFGTEPANAAWVLRNGGPTENVRAST